MLEFFWATIVLAASLASDQPCHSVVERKRPTVERNFEQEVDALVRMLEAMETRQRENSRRLHLARIASEIGPLRELLQDMPKRDNLGKAIE